MRNCKIKNLALVPACFNEDFLAWNKSKGLKIDLCPVSKSARDINVSAEKFIKTAFQGSDHNILIINFKVNLSSICLICLGVASTEKLVIGEFTSDWEPSNLPLLWFQRHICSTLCCPPKLLQHCKSDWQVFKSRCSGNFLDIILEVLSVEPRECVLFLAEISLLVWKLFCSCVQWDVIIVGSDISSFPLSYI